MMTSTPDWQCLTFDKLSAHQLYQILKLRAEVFVVEQECAYLDPDNLDQQSCWHLFTTEPGTGQVIAYCRILEPGIVYPGSTIGRVVVSESKRSEGFGKQIMEQAIQFCRQRWSDKAVELSGQCQWEGFYQNLGFTSQGNTYLEDGIPHIHMIMQ